MSGYKLDNEQIQEIETVFCFFDKDKDGVLNLRDATNALRSLGKDPTDAQIKGSSLITRGAYFEKKTNIGFDQRALTSLKLCKKTETQYYRYKFSIHSFQSF